MKSMLQVADIDAYYGKKQILHKITLDVDAGEKVLLVGPNGAGKTTLLKAISGLLSYQVGIIRFSGENLNGVSIKDRIAKGIGYLLQTENIVPGLTVSENLDIGGFFLAKKELGQQKSLVLDSLKLIRPKLDSRAGVLSGGERQTLALGMVLMSKPRLLLLDEPSAGLAPKTAKEILGHLKQIQETFQIETICMVEHNLKLALNWASRVVVLVQGRIAYISDTPEDFIEDPRKLERYFFE